MTSPRNATTKPGGQRLYSWRGEKYWSVTTIIGGGIPKPALIHWSANEVASFACDHVDQVKALMEKDERDAAYDLLKRSPWRKKEKAADLGSSVHAAVEAYVLGKPFPKWTIAVKPRMAAFEKFLADYEPDYEGAEMSVYNRTQRYAGTLDAICAIRGRKLITDVKSGKGVYPETALQLAAYRYAEFVGMADGSEKQMPDVDACAVLHLPEAGGSYELMDVRADRDVFRAFLFVREVFRWQEETSKSVILGPLLTEVTAVG